MRNTIFDGSIMTFQSSGLQRGVFVKVIIIFFLICDIFIFKSDVHRAHASTKRESDLCYVFDHKYYYYWCIFCCVLWTMPILSEIVFGPS